MAPKAAECLDQAKRPVAHSCAAWRGSLPDEVARPQGWQPSGSLGPAKSRAVATLLSPQELEVSRLASKGLSNRDLDFD